MEFHRNGSRPTDGGSVVVTGSSLSEAFKRVRKEFGPEAVISDSRSRLRRKSSGWGTEKVVEVVVESPRSAGSRQSGPDFPAGDLTDEIRHEVERLERLVQNICRTEDVGPRDEHHMAENPLAEHLVENGASSGAVERLLTRFTGETGMLRNDRPQAIAWLTGYLGTGEKTLADWSGNHVFLSEHAADRLDPVLHMARCLTEAGRRVLVVSVLPDADRDEPRLQSRAAASGHDAAVVRDVDQLKDMEAHLEGYDLVLVDLPALTDVRLIEGGTIHRWLASNEKFHRHLLVPMDRDFLDLTDLREASRSWNCDWLALTRLDGTRHPAKLLDLIDSIPLPVSFMADISVGDGILASATAELLLDRILAQDMTPRFKPGLEADAP